VTIQDAKITEADFVVVMVSKARARPPAGAALVLLVRC